ncbi:MAG TPA: hypothetical protein PLN31_08365 [Azoarcus taiwanensis]|nr:hypothetical protein [Azoarcus taiwanensis]
MIDPRSTSSLLATFCRNSIARQPNALVGCSLPMDPLLPPHFNNLPDVATKSHDRFAHNHWTV